MFDNEANMDSAAPLFTLLPDANMCVFVCVCARACYCECACVPEGGRRWVG